MLRSMTAYGRHAIDSSMGELTWELRSVNHRYLEVSVRLPDELRALEPVVREKVSARLHRGKVEVGCRLRAQASTERGLSVDDAVLNQLVTAVCRLQEQLPEATQIDPVRLLQWPGLLAGSQADRDLLKQQAVDALDTALDDFVAAREREGEKTAELLRQKVVSIAEHVAALREVRPAVVARQRQRLVAKLEELDIEHDSHRLEQELVYVAQRLDVDEELDRLAAHVTELQDVLERDDAVGRRLDFLMQEFNREANTLGSKAADLDTTGASVDIKVLIEQMREQVQNVE